MSPVRVLFLCLTIFLETSDSLEGRDIQAERHLKDNKLEGHCFYPERAEPSPALFSDQEGKSSCADRHGSCNLVPSITGALVKGSACTLSYTLSCHRKLVLLCTNYRCRASYVRHQRWALDLWKGLDWQVASVILTRCDRTMVCIGSILHYSKTPLIFLPVSFHGKAWGTSWCPHCHHYLFHHLEY